mmetsp:Transcript_3715/g.8368  ORF Transcript_3715/g.8368 Transcript_3715/m.8368 type:complete len:230 (+) Transcript_3715:302-991(+)|eukprot:CAMPEP_0178501796 /NCGR_PEP_ID=MMETSP0696-20121128/17150_1 /TAXON_ID=265572 /ORGANISM="Extubocellulus spinifer, Strain CCMP396" /LENGTH=229 /DNA_ID=CAMNT_0020130787 /DNA_START=216 /DNA_END=905 /DNA_ORIENTATION=-
MKISSVVTTFFASISFLASAAKAEEPPVSLLRGSEGSKARALWPVGIVGDSAVKGIGEVCYYCEGGLCFNFRGDDSLCEHSCEFGPSQVPRCVPQHFRGRIGEYCIEDYHCSSRNCGSKSSSPYRECKRRSICKSNPNLCKNGGTCEDLSDGSAICHCPFPYKRPFCVEEDDTDCAQEGQRSQQCGALNPDRPKRCCGGLVCDDGAGVKCVPRNSRGYWEDSRGYWEDF